MANNPDPPGGGKPDNDPAGGFSTVVEYLKWLVLQLVTLNPRVATAVIVVSTIVFSLVAMSIAGTFHDSSKEMLVFVKPYALAAAGFTVLIWLASVWRSLRLVANVVLWGFVAYAGLFMAELLAGDSLVAMELRCYPNPFRPNCPGAEVFTPAYMIAAIPPTEVVAELGETNPDLNTNASTDAAVVEQPVIEMAPPPAGRVFVHFAGALAREDVVIVSEAMKAEGWDMQSANRGGERLASAVGLNEVRFFHAEDRDAALRLATEFAELAVWVSQPALEVRDFSTSGLNARPGQLEIWTSVK